MMCENLSRPKIIRAEEGGGGGGGGLVSKIFKNFVDFS